MNWKSCKEFMWSNGQVMAVYGSTQTVANGTVTTNKLQLRERHIYGASRLGMVQSTIDLLSVSVTQNVINHEVGTYRYEITNWLGNVNAVISDRKKLNPLASSVEFGFYYSAVIFTKADYYPFGMTMPGRTQDLDKYRYAYNGMESDNELSGTGNSYTTEFRQYDPRIARWKSLDPLAAQAPGWSPYRAFFDNPISNTDRKGLYETKQEANRAMRKAKKAGIEVSEKGVYKSGDEYLFNGVEDGENVTYKKAKVFESKVASSDKGSYNTGTWALIGSTNLNNRFNFNTGIVTGGNPFREGSASPEVKKEWKKNRAKTENVNAIAKGLLTTYAAIATGGALGMELAGTGYVSSAVNSTVRVAKLYHKTIGKAGGYKSMAMELTSQTTTQVFQGNWSFYDYNLLGIFTSSLLGGKFNTLKLQMIQGASGTLASYTINGGKDGFLFKDKSAGWVVFNTLNGILTPVMGTAPLINNLGGEIINETLSGGIQGAIEIIEKQNKTN